VKFISQEFIRVLIKLRLKLASIKLFNNNKGPSFKLRGPSILSAFNDT
jgi:hypothetical protein